MSRHLFRIEPDRSTLTWLSEAIGPGTTIVARSPLPPASHSNDHVVLETSTGTILELLLRRFTDAGLLGTDT